MATPAARVILGYGLGGGGNPQIEQKLRLITLPAPSTGAAQAFALALTENASAAANATTSSSPPMLLELSRHKTKHAAWAVGRAVLADGGVVLATPVDPLLVLLPLLRPAPASTAEGAAEGAPPPMFQDLDGLLTDPRWPGLAQLRPLVEPLLPLICEVKQVQEDEEEEEEGEGSGRRRTTTRHYYRLSDARAAAYLRLMAKRAAQALRDCRSPAAAQLDDAHALAYALGWLGEWVSAAWLAVAAAGLGGGGSRIVPVGLPGAGSKAAAAAPAADASGLLQVAGSGAFIDNKRPYGGGGGGVFDDGGGAGVTPEQKADAAKAKAEATRQANKTAKMVEAGKGSRKISSFFGGGGGAKK
jgi:hypothetical protein